MGMVMGVTSVLIGIAASLAGLIVWTALIFPGPAASARTVLVRRPGRCFLTGIGIVLALGLPALVLVRSPHGLAKLAGWALALPLFSLLLLGLTAMAQTLGERMRQLSPGATPLGALVRGAITLELAVLMPFFGWLLFAPLVGLTVLGAGALGCLARRRGSMEDDFFTTETRRHGDRPEGLQGKPFQVGSGA